jgi:3-oxoacyl-[acyl-carrier-protein] synthase II
MDSDGTADREQALVNVMRQALSMAKVEPAGIGHLHAHGVGTRAGDVAESRAVLRVLGDQSQSPPVVAAKSNFGNLGAASGMVELIGSLMAMEAGHLFATLNYETPDPDCPVAVVTDPSIPSGLIVLNVNVTPQGQASATIVRRFSS